MDPTVEIVRRLEARMVACGSKLERGSRTMRPVKIWEAFDSRVLLHYDSSRSLANSAPVRCVSIEVERGHALARNLVRAPGQRRWFA